MHRVIYLCNCLIAFLLTDWILLRACCKCWLWVCFGEGWNITAFCHVALTACMHRQKGIKRVFNMLDCPISCHSIDVLWLKSAPPHACLSLLFPFYPSPFSPPTGNRWEVKGVTCGGSGLLPLACQCLITHTHTFHHILGERPIQLGAITGVIQAHTNISTWTHQQPCSWCESSRVTLNHLWPFLCLF